MPPQVHLQMADATNLPFMLTLDPRGLSIWTQGSPLRVPLQPVSATGAGLGSAALATLNGATLPQDEVQGNEGSDGQLRLDRDRWWDYRGSPKL